jgi:hypothetical protein
MTPTLNESTQMEFTMSDEKTKAAGGEPAAADTVASATCEDSPIVPQVDPASQDFHLNRACRFGILAAVARRFGDLDMCERMLTAQSRELAIANQGTMDK